MGARSAAWQAVWLRRDAGNVYDPWNLPPSAVIGKLTELQGVLAKNPA